MAKGRFASLRSRLLALVFLPILPVLGQVISNAIQQRAEATAKVKEDAQDLAELAATDERLLLHETHRLLVIIGRDPEVRTGDAALYGPFLKALLNASPDYANLGILDSKGELLFSAVPTSYPISAGDRAGFERALETRDFAMGDCEAGRQTHRPAVSFFLPIWSPAGVLERVIFATVDLNEVNHRRSTVHTRLPADATLAKIDSKGVVLLHEPEPERWVGRRMPDSPLVRTIIKRRSGTVELAGFDEVERLYAFAPVQSTLHSGEIFVVFGVPRRVAYADVNRSLLRNLGWLGGVACLALLAAWLSADFFIMRRVNPLLRAAERLAGGDLAARSGIAPGLGEMNQLAQTFDQMAGALERREAESREAAAALAASEAGMRALVAAMTDLILVFDAAGRYLKIPRTNPTILYRPAQELIGRTVREVFPDPQGEFFLEAIQRTVEGRQPVNIEYSLPIGDASRWFTCTLSPMLEDKAVAVVRDITERKEAEEALRKSEQEKALILDSISEHVVYHDRDMRTRWANRATAQEGGLQPDQLAGQHCYEVWHQRATPCDGCPIADALRTGEPREGEMSFPGGRTLLMRGYPVRDERGEIRGVVEVSLDVTARKGAQEKLQRQEEYFRSLIENTSDMILIVAADRTIRYISPVVEKLLAYKPEEVVGQEAGSFVHVEDAPRLATVFANAAWNPGQLEVLEFRLRHKNGKWVAVEGVAKNLLQNPAVDGFVGSIRDITERKQLQEQLRQSDRLQAIGRLAGGVAHDFNNLLTAVVGYSDLLLHRLGPDSALRRDVLEIKRAGERATSLTQQLLAFSRRQVLQPKVLNLNNVVAEMHKMLCRLIGEDVDLVTVLVTGLGRVKADQGQIEQIIMNLAVNARDAMPQGGKLTIETANVELDEQYCRQHIGMQPGPYVMLALSDTGCGMDAETLAQIFEPFFTTKELGKGTGLGLATVYGIVRQSGGHIWAYSEVGTGSTFKIYLPRVEEPIGLPESTAARVHVARGTETVLVVEDEDEIRNLICVILREYGYTVQESRESLGAVEICENTTAPLHLLITDVVMPGMGGRELAEVLRNMRAGIKVLYISGYTEDAIVRHGVLDRGTHFLQKPFPPDLLARTVRAILDETKHG